MYYDELDMIIQTLPFVDRDWIPVQDIVEDADPSILFEGEAFHSILENEGISTYGIADEEVKDSEYTDLTTGEETEIRPYRNITEMAFKVRETLNQESGKKYVYAYTDLIDKTCHEYGPGSDEEKVQLENISDSLSRELGKVDEDIAEETLVLFSADHGQIKASEEIDLMKYQEVEKRLKERDRRPITPCGSARSVFLHVKKGEVEDLKEFLEEEIDAEIYRTEEAVEEGLFGHREVGENFYSRAGDLLIIPNGRKAYWYDTDEYEQEGFHGGLHEDEMFVPLTVTRLSELL
jgi:predicted AlkP superfamily pyrophosphatase or phosphodiesterase